MVPCGIPVTYYHVFTVPMGTSNINTRARNNSVKFHSNLMNSVRTYYMYVYEVNKQILTFVGFYITEIFQKFTNIALI